MMKVMPLSLGRIANISAAGISLQEASIAHLAAALAVKRRAV